MIKILLLIIFIEYNLIYFIKSKENYNSLLFI
jgi:hypothetical protein